MERDVDYDLSPEEDAVFFSEFDDRSILGNLYDLNRSSVIGFRHLSSGERLMITQAQESGRVREATEARDILVTQFGLDFDNHPLLNSI